MANLPFPNYSSPLEVQPFRILLVDDETDVVEFLSYNLRKEGYPVLTADNGKEAIEIAIKEKPHHRKHPR